MMKFLRSQSQTVLICVLAVIGVGFLFYGNTGNLLTGGGPHLPNDYGRIDGTDLTYGQLINAVRATRNGVILAGQGQMLSQPGAREEIANNAWSRLLLLSEADRMHVIISDEQLAEFIKGQPMFQKDGAFSPALYQMIMAQLPQILGTQVDSMSPDPLAQTKLAYENLMRENLRVTAVVQALFSTIHTPVKDAADEYEHRYGAATVSVISLDPKPFVDAVAISPAEIEAVYKAHPMDPAFRTKEKRKVEYVLFPLTPEQQKLSAAEKKVAKNSLGEKALEFALAFQPEPIAKPGTPPPPTPDFDTEAKKRSLTPQTTEFFSGDQRPANVPPSPSFNQAAFDLSKDNPISKVVELDNGVAVVRLVEIQPSELLPLDQVKDSIIAQLKQDKGAAALRAAATKDVQDLRAALAKGTDFKTAAAALKLKVETLPPYVPMTVSQDDIRLATIAFGSVKLKKGEDSEPFDAPDGGEFITYLDNRAPADPAGLSGFEARLRSARDEQVRNMVYIDWVNWRSEQPGTHRPAQLAEFGGAE